MRIIHVITRLLRAGSEENTIASCLAQVARGHEVYLVHGREYDKHYYDKFGTIIRFRKVDSLVHQVNGRSDVRSLCHMTALFHSLRPDLVHTHQSKAGILGRFAARAAGVPKIVHGVHIVPFVSVGPLQRVAYLAAERAAAAVTHAFIDVSGGMRDVCVSNKVGRPQQHHVIHSGFDLTRFKGAQPPADWREILSIGPYEEKPPTLVIIAALEPRKRHREFLEAFPRILARVPNARLIMAGEGACRTEIDAKISELGLLGRARLIGYRSDPERIIALADLCALTSTREGLPRVVMQYLAVGRPCVVSDLPGIGEVLQSGFNGIITPADDMDSTADAIADLLSDTDRLVALAQGAASTNLSSWDVAKMCVDIESVYATI